MRTDVMSKVVPVILSGGSGSRLWPLSRSMYPKQFIKLNGGELSLLGATLKRLSSNDGFGKPIILANNDHRFLVKAEIDAARCTPRAIFLEPVSRNTAAAIAVAALTALKDDPSAVIVVMPSDHVIENQSLFIDAVLRGVEIAQQEKLVLFGIKATEPHTGYGYIKEGDQVGTENDAFTVAAFCEKPDREIAERYLQEGRYHWNSGIFALNAGKFIDELAVFEPTILEAAQKALASAEVDLDFTRLDRAAFSQSPNISIDCAVMERTASAVVLPIDVGWSDIGSWSSLWNIAEHDKSGNYVNGDALLLDSERVYVHSDRALVTTIGLKDLIVVSTPDALLIADRNRAQDVSKVVAELKSTGRKEHEQHLRNHRPWGFFETLNLSPRFQVKLLHVKPGAKLSMQMHHHRSEHWIVVHGTARVTIGDTDKLVRENESVYIFATQWHRLENPGKVPLELIEVQIGTYLGEDDIVRTDDMYRRAADETR